MVGFLKMYSFIYLSFKYFENRRAYFENMQGVLLHLKSGLFVCRPVVG